METTRPTLDSTDGQTAQVATISRTGSPPLDIFNPPVVAEYWCHTQVRVTKLRYIWTISNFSFCREELGEVVKSSIFSSGPNEKLKWCLRINPKGLDEESREYLSLYLLLVNCGTKSEARAKFKFSILNSKREETKAMESQRAYRFVQGKDWGFKKFIRRDVLMDEASGLLPNDRLTLVCEISVVGETMSDSGHINSHHIAIPECRLHEDIGTLLFKHIFTDVTLVVVSSLGQNCPSRNCSYSLPEQQTLQGIMQVSENLNKYANNIQQDDHQDVERGEVFDELNDDEDVSSRIDETEVLNFAEDDTPVQGMEFRNGDIDNPIANNRTSSIGAVSTTTQLPPTSCLTNVPSMATNQPSLCASMPHQLLSASLPSNPVVGSTSGTTNKADVLRPQAFTSKSDECSSQNRRIGLVLHTSRRQSVQYHGNTSSQDKLSQWVCTPPRISSSASSTSATPFRQTAISNAPATSVLRQFSAHKSILAARSPVFAAMFEHQMEESRANRVQITDIEPDVLAEILRFIYTGKVIGLDRMAQELIAAADKYQLERLKAMCEDALVESLTIESSCDILSLADVHSAEQLKAHTLDFIMLHAQEVCETEGYERLVNQRPHLLNECFRTLACQQLPLRCWSRKRHRPS